jgi:hypothetical protein
MTNTTNGFCGNCGGAGCEVRAARGLKRFCELPQVAAPVQMSGFATRAEAEAVRLPGQSVVGIRGGLGHGPMRFFLRGKVRA